MLSERGLSSTQYFSAVGLFSLLVVLVLVWRDAEAKQILKERFGLVERLEASKDSFYQQRVQRIFEQYCVACHGEAKAKGDLQMHDFRHNVFGGRSGDMLRGGVSSLLFERMSLSEDDRFAMPPYGRDRQTEEELAVIRLWLEKGASGVLTEADFPNAPKKPRDIRFLDVDSISINAARQPLSEQVHDLQRTYGTGLAYLARTSHLVVIDTIGTSIRLSDEMLADFKPLSSVITRLNIPNSTISDSSIPVIIDMIKLRHLNVSGSQISEHGLLQLTQLSELKRLIVDDHIVSKDIEQKLSEHDVKIVRVGVAQ